MERYHHSPATGKVVRCTVSVATCAAGGYEAHFTSRDLAENFYRSEAGGKPSLEPDELASAAVEELQALVAAKDEPGLLGFVERRAGSDLMKDAVQQRENLRAALSVTEEAYQAAKEALASPKGDLLKNARVQVREAALKHRDVYEALALHMSRMAEYRKPTAQAAYAASVLREERERAAGTFLTYDEETIGSLVSIGAYDSGTDAWHAVRADGIGGSDVGSIMRVDKTYGYANYRRTLLAKLGEEEGDEDPEARTDEATAIGRGNAWEEAIRQRYQDENPELRVAFCKTSWAGAGEHSYRHANFDGLILNTEGVPEGIVEIKTGSNPSKWGPVTAGLDGVPPEYRKQVLWYAANASLRYGVIVALLDDHDYREYHFSMNDPQIVAEVSEIFESTDEFWAKVQKEKAAREKGVKKRKRARGFGKKVDYLRVAEVLAAYSGWSLTTAQKAIFRSVADFEEAVGRSLTPEENQLVLTEAFADHDPTTRSKPLIGIDLETTTASPRTGRIIETGVVRLDAVSEPEIAYSSLHGLPAHALEGVGIGLTSVHGIDEPMLQDKPLFETPEEAAKILALLKEGVLVAHNAGFEDRFLIVNLPGYAEARDAGEIVILDTRTLSRYLMTRSEDSSLQSFSEDNGVPYTNSHRAISDSLMMVKALRNLQATIHKRGKFYTKRASEAARRRSLRELSESQERS